jgi:hypothetical protein
MTNCEQLWNELSLRHERPVFRRVDESNPADLYVGIGTTEKFELMLLYDLPVAELPLFESLLLSQNLRNDGRYALVLQLEQSQLKAAFAHLCDDLAETLRRARPSGNVGQVFLARLKRWRGLLRPGRADGLTDAEVRGLIGELLILEQLFGHSGPLVAVDSWVGPDEAPQDFVLSGLLIEAKTCRSGTHEVTISSLEQLHSSGPPIFLMVVYLSPAPPEEANSLSLNSLVLRLRAALETVPAARDEFEVRLYQAGFVDGWEGNNQTFRCDGIRSYAVDDNFPKLTVGAVPRGIAHAMYAVDLLYCSALNLAAPWT